MIKQHQFAARIALAIASSLASFAYANGEGDLVVEPVDVARVSALSRNHVSWATAENDLGEVADNLKLSHLNVVLNRSAQQQLAFDQFLSQQQDPNSTNFHHWLTPVEIGEQFGASSHDIDAITHWLQSQGLQIDAVANSRTRIDFSGSAANVGAAFAARLHFYVVNGEQRIAPVGVPQIPAALSAIVRSVFGLSSIDERPLHHTSTTQFVGKSAQPTESNCSGDPCIHFVFPADFAAIYNLNPVYQQGINGAGQTIAIIGRARVYLPDIENFQAKSHLTAKDPVIVVPPDGIDPGPALSSGGTSPSDGDQSEATLDVTRASSIAPGATIELVISANPPSSSGLAVASQYVVDTVPVSAQIMNISFGNCENKAGPSFVDMYDNIFSQAAAEGISVFVSSGDSGAAACDTHSTAPPSSQFASTNAFCASSHATCVGATQFADTVNPSAYWASSNGTGFESALGYIPEGAMNEPLDNSGSPQIFASGGGVSMFIPTPIWQTGPGVPGTQGRYIPDVSFSGSGHDGYFMCFAAIGNSCITDTSGHFMFSVESGTSASAPDMAGITALLNQSIGSAQGNLNPRLYALAAIGGNAVFHDVTVSTSGVSGCDASLPSLCNNSTPGPSGLSGGLAGYLVGPGYDEVTGLGSINVANLLAQWNAPSAITPKVGVWWNPLESGSGYAIDFKNGVFVIQIYSYQTSGPPQWYLAAGSLVGNTFTSTLDKYVDGQCISCSYLGRPALVGNDGTVTIVFSSSTTATMYLPNGRVTQIQSFF